MEGRSYHQRKILKGRTTFQWAYLLKFWSVWLPSTFVEEELKKGGKNNKNAIGTLQLSLQVLITTMYCLAELSLAQLHVSAYGN